MNSRRTRGAECGAFFLLLWTGQQKRWWLFFQERPRQLIFSPHFIRKHARASLWLLAAVMMLNGAARGQAFNGMDRNDYPGDALLSTLHKSFSYTSYWLNAPPGEKTNTLGG